MQRELCGTSVENERKGTRRVHPRVPRKLLGKVSHVLRAIGLSDEQARSTVRFGLSRFTTGEEVDEALSQVIAAVRQLRATRSSV